ncbi:MAG: YpsA SLOG family protein [Fibrobacterota bacterium]
MVEKIISGGQTGADRGALNAALALEFPCGGYCPSGRRAEDGVIPDTYPLQEIDGGYDERTRRNIADADGAVLFSEGSPDGEIRRTEQLCRESAIPVVLIDTERFNTTYSSHELRDFCEEFSIITLYISGTRGSQSPYIESYVYKSVIHFIERLTLRLRFF